MSKLKKDGANVRCNLKGNSLVTIREGHKGVRIDVKRARRPGKITTGQTRQG